MNSVHFVLQAVPGTADQLNDRLREVSEKVNKSGFDPIRVFEQIKIPVKEMVFGPNHIGVLLEDGKAYRVQFSINSERLDLSKSESSKNSSSKNSAPSSSRQLARSRARLMRTTARSGSSGQNSGSRSTGVIIAGSSSGRPLVTVAAPFVPEELISQAEVVLQGKSRNLIIRELQRTNLDVNLAVNNLLSRDDEEVEENEDGADSYVPEDLISLLDNGFHGDNNSVIIDPADGLFSEEIFSNYSSIRNLLFDRIRSERNQSNVSNSDGPQNRLSAANAGGLNGANSLATQGLADREAFSRWRDRQCYNPRRWINKDEMIWEKEAAETKKKESATTNSPIWISDELQPWPIKNTIRFRKIAALFSELVALSESGDLYQWKWGESEPFKSEHEHCHHPKTMSLNITEKIEHISTSFIRASVVTENNRVATWMDDQIGYCGMKLEHSAIAFSDFVIDPIVSIHVCSLYSVVRTESNSVYWWGVLPFEQRRFLWDKNRSKSKKPSKVLPEITVGTQVIMKKCPIYQLGSIGFTFTNGVPKVGQLLNSVWDFNDVCRFKILNGSSTANCEKILAGCLANSNPLEAKDVTKSSGNLTPATVSLSSNKLGVVNSSNKESSDRIDMPPPPSPASSTCSDTGSVISHKRNKRMVAKDDLSDNRKDEEFWQLKDVVIVEEKIGPIGKVLKVDGEYIAVRFPVSVGSNVSPCNSSEGKEDDWQQCRLLRRDDVKIYKTALNIKGPDWLQKLPKKIQISSGNDPCQLLSLCVDTSGIHAIKKVGSKIYYSVYNLFNCKQEQSYKLTTDSVAFLGNSVNNINMMCNNDNGGGCMILLDGNRTIYPFAKDCLNAIKDPCWLDLPPIKSLSIKTISLPSSSGNNLKTKVCMMALIFECQKLMPHVLRCDAKNVLNILNNLEKDKQNILPIIEERCDGCRNIFHACIAMSAPTSNKEPEEKEKKPTQPSFGLNSRPISTSFSNIQSESAFDSTTSTNTLNPAPATYLSGSTNTSMVSSSGREGRTVSLREMMNKLISNDNIEQPVSSINANMNQCVVDDHYYNQNWTGDSTITPNSNFTEAFCSHDDDISKTSKFCSPMNTSLNMPYYISDPIERREQSLLILQYMCSSPVLRPFLIQLLSSKDSLGQTPFMLAISCRSYDAAIILLSTILNVSEKETSIQKDLMIFPPGSPPDMSPLYVICYNDTCSFTWTGADHINQNIFECKTCGLTGSLCCCTECARVCHRGHDCKLKRTSPTAYCDCWEKCKCKALIAGNQQKRYALLCKLVSTTDLVKKFNSKGESILLFLIQTVGRQTIEQRQYRANSRARNVAHGQTTSSSRKPSAVEVDSDLPDHDLEPPKFARRALERLLVDWPAVQSMIMAGAEELENYSAENHNIYIQTQKGSTLLDKFTHSLFVKCSSEHIETLLMTLIHELQNDYVEGQMTEAELVVRRFIRSVVRVFVIFNLEKQPNPDKRKCSTAPNKHIQSCIKVFQNFHKISIQELCEVAEALISPVRSGVLRPTAPFAMSSSNIDCSDDLFCVEPLAPASSFLDRAESMHENPSETTGYNLHPTYERAIGTRKTSESENSVNRDNSRGHDEDLIESGRHDEANQDDESDNEFTYNDAETESDSEDNQSNHETQEISQTRTAGSDTDESEDSSPPDEEPSEDGETDDHSDDLNSVTSQNLERRNAHTNIRNESTPQTMQWAIRSRDAYRSTLRVAPGSSLVFIDPMALRRSNLPATSAVTAPQDPQTLATTASNLARAFGITIRQISELFSNISYNMLNNVETPLKLSSCDKTHLQAFVESRLKPTWDWLFSVMDTTEAQLKFGAYLTNHTDPAHPLHPLNLSSHSSLNQSTMGPVGLNMIASSRREFFTYCLSLMRAHTSEHLDALPVLDISSLKHIAYVLDAIIYYMRSDTLVYDKKDLNSSSFSVNFSENYDTDEELSNITTDESFSVLASCNSAPRRSSLFFLRSDSTLSLGCQAPDGFGLPLDEAIPLADKPHLLQPNAKREDLFANVPLLSSNKLRKEEEASPYDQLPTRLGFSNYTCCKPPNILDKNYKSNQCQMSTHKNIYKCHCDEYTSKFHDQLTRNKCSDEEKPCFEFRSFNDKLNSKAETNIKSSEECTEKIKDYLPTTGRPGIIVAPNKTQDLETVQSNMPANDKIKCLNARSVIVRPTYEGNADFSAKNTNSEHEHSNSFPRGYNFCNAIASTNSSAFWNILIGRWKLTLDLFSRVFMDDVGMENSSILPELRGFHVKEMRFRRQMEKLRNGQQRDLILSKLERTRDCLIIQTFKELNTLFGSQNRRAQPPLAFNRVKVTFRDEPGEGSGVARSFYTTITEALLSSARMPNLESVQAGCSNKYGVPFSSILRTRGSSGKDTQVMQKRGSGNKILWRSARERRALNHDARPFVSFVNNIADNFSDNTNEHLTVHLQQLGERLFPKVYAISPEYAQKITGMILELPTTQLLSILSSDDMLRQRVNEALEIIDSKQNTDASSSCGTQLKKLVPVVLLEHCQVDDNEPLFYSPGKRGFYSPRQGYGTFERLNAFRNIGRLMGICLQQNELLPLCLQRHVLKYILGRKVKFHDMAFFDPAIYESFRQLLHSSKVEGNEDIKRMELYFVIDLVKEEGGGSIELLPGGREIQVTGCNIFDYVKRYTEYRLIKSQKKALEAMKDGVFDVLPETCLSSLTAEDLRLLLNGAGDINVPTLISYTTFNDESSESSDKLIKFKRWFWSIVEKMNTLERQDLIYFWTGSPALPASEEGFQPLPSVTIRPADDTHLPTANTCISRLYIPLYSSKSILRCKLLLAIKSKSFGFV